MLIHRWCGFRVTPSRLALAFTHQIVIEDEFVTIGDQQIRSRLFDADTDNVLGVLAQFGHQRRKIGVAADNDEGIDVRLGVAQVKRIDDHADVGGIFARLAQMRNLDQFKIGLVHGGLEGLVTLPVTIGFFQYDAALQEQAFEHWFDVEFFIIGVAYAQGDVLEITEHRHADGFRG